MIELDTNRPATFNDRQITKMVWRHHTSKSDAGLSSVAVVAETLKTSEEYVRAAMMRVENTPVKAPRKRDTSGRWDR